MDHASIYILNWPWEKTWKTVKIYKTAVLAYPLDSPYFIVHFNQTASLDFIAIPILLIFIWTQFIESLFCGIFEQNHYCIWNFTKYTWKTHMQNTAPEATKFHTFIFIFATFVLTSTLLLTIKVNSLTAGWGWLRLNNGYRRWSYVTWRNPVLPRVSELYLTQVNLILILSKIHKMLLLPSSFSCLLKSSQHQGQFIHQNFSPSSQLL